MPNNRTTRRAPKSISFGNNSYYNKPRNNNNIWASKPVGHHVSHYMKWTPETNIVGIRPKNAQYRSENTRYNKTYYNHLKKIYNLSKTETEEEFMAKTIEGYKNALESGYSQEQINSWVQNEFKDWKKRRPIAERERLSSLASEQSKIQPELKRRENMQQMSANFAKMVANIELNNTNTNANYQRKVRNALNRNFNSRKSNTRKNYLNREFKKMFGLNINK